MSTLIISANASRATLLECSNLHSEHPTLQTIKNLVHTDSELKNSDLIANDRSGQTHTTNGINGAVPHSDPKHKEAEKFAKLLAEEVKDIHRKGSYQSILLVASPEFCGLLKKHLDANLGPIEALNKDYTLCSDKELSQHLAKQIFLKNP